MFYTDNGWECGSIYSTVDWLNSMSPIWYEDIHTLLSVWWRDLFMSNTVHRRYNVKSHWKVAILHLNRDWNHCDLFGHICHILTSYIAIGKYVEIMNVLKMLNYTAVSKYIIFGLSFCRTVSVNNHLKFLYHRLIREHYE